MPIPLAPVQIRTLRSQQAVLRSVTRRNTTTEGLTSMTELTWMSAAERRTLIQDFVTETLQDLDVPTYRHGLLAATPELPADPTDEQVDAWIELSELVADPALRSGMRRMARYAAEHAPGEQDEDALREVQCVSADCDGCAGPRIVQYVEALAERLLFLWPVVADDAAEGHGQGRVRIGVVHEAEASHGHVFRGACLQRIGCPCNETGCSWQTSMCEDGIRLTCENRNRCRELGRKRNQSATVSSGRHLCVRPFLRLGTASRPWPADHADVPSPCSYARPLRRHL